MDAKCQKVYCNCCTTPVAELKDGVLIVRVKHHGEEHETRIVLTAIDSRKVLVVT